MSSLARYSIVRYVQDVERGEAVNVGILLDTGDGSSAVLCRFEERETVPEGVVRRFASVIESTVRDGREATLDDLASRRFAHFTVTPPRAVRTDDDPQATLRGLVDRLVSEQHAVVR